MIQIPINLDITKPYRTPIEINQFDTNEPVFLITLRNNGVLIDLTGATVVFYAKKPDGNVLFNACDITDAAKGKCMYTVTSQTTAAAGTLTCQIVVTFASGAEKRSQEFSVTVEPSLDITGAIESTSEFTALQQAITQVGDITGLDVRVTQTENDIGTLQTLMDNIVTTVKHAMYPVGSIIFTTTSTNPSAEYGGTWEAWGAGRVPVGVDSEQSEFETVEKTGGGKTHKLTISEMPSHNHVVTLNAGTQIGTYNNASKTNNFTGQYNAANVSFTGGNEPHNNLQPYITCYMWKRVA